MEANGFRVIHRDGLTGSDGPSTVCAWQETGGELGLQDRSAKMARQGVNYLTLEAAEVIDAGTMVPVTRDGATMGELMLRGKTVMKGYLKNPAATEEALRGGLFPTGDPAVRTPDGSIGVKDRSQDTSISRSKNINNLKGEEATQ